MRISDWSSDVCSSDLRAAIDMQGENAAARAVAHAADKLGERQSVFSVAALQEEAGRIGLGKIGYAQIGAAIDAAAKQGALIDRLHIDRRGPEFADRQSTRVHSSPSCATRLPASALKQKNKTTHSTSDSSCS